MKWRPGISIADECRLAAIHADDKTADLLKRAAAAITARQTLLNEITRICSNERKEPETFK